MKFFREGKFLLFLGVVLFTAGMLTPVDSWSAHNAKVIEKSHVALANGKTAAIERNTLIVKFRDGIARSEQQRILGQLHLAGRRGPDRGGYHLVELFPPPGTAMGLAEAMEALSRFPQVESVSSNYVCRADFVPENEYFDYQWGLQLSEFDQAWDLQQAAPHVVVAVLDSGVAYEDYSDLTGTYFKAPQFEGVSLTQGYDFVNDDSHPNDDFGHGTHIASIISGALGSMSSTIGASYGCSIMPVKVLDSEGTGTVDSLTRGITFSVDNGANIINMSLSFSHGLGPDDLLSLAEAIDYASSNNAVLVASSGNDGMPAVNYPARFNACIAVGAIGGDGLRPMYSNYGPGLDVVAPGGNPERTDGAGHPDAILAVSFPEEDWSDFGYWWAAGTSQAAAHVSSQAALLRSAGVSDALQIFNIIVKTAGSAAMDPSGAEGYRLETGNGLISARKALVQSSGIFADALEGLPGYYDGQSGDLDEIAHMIGMVASHRDGVIAIIDDGQGVYGLINGEAAGTVILFRLPSDMVENLDGIRAFNGGLLALIDASGGLLGLLDAAGGPLGIVEAAGGVLGLLEASGGLLALLDAAGGPMALLDNNGALLGILGQNGGLMALVEANGALLGLIDSNGGLLGMLEATGGLLGILDSAGGLIGILDVNCGSRTEFMP